MVRSKLLAIALIYAGSWCYVIAAHYHVGWKNWSFLRAFALALPLVIIEYNFSLRGNKMASEMSLSALQVLIVTVSFYVINLSILNYFFLKQPFNIFRDTISILLVLAAIAISTQLGSN